MNLRPSSALRIAVLGYIVRGPLGGLAWHHLQYVMGLARLGHDVRFIEDSDDFPGCYDPSRHVTDTDPSYGIRFAGAAFDRVGLAGAWAYHDAHAGRWLGPAGGSAEAFCRSADIILNVSCVNPVRPWFANAPVRALIDTDPVYTQVRHLTDADARARAEQHTHFFTFAENLPAGRATVPDDGLPWLPTRQPVVLDAWPVTPAPEDAAFTTVMLWNSYKPVVHDGVRYGMKSDAFTPYWHLPERVSQPLEMAVGSGGVPRADLEKAGWRLRDSLEPTTDPWAYQRYIRASRAEFTVAKEGYVISRSGWFSERSAGYLASGRPVVVQETGFSDVMGSGEGVIAFASPEEAVDAIDRVSGDYAFHCRRARTFAADHFASETVLGDLLDAVAAQPEPTSPRDG